jgi:hypothetical protein
MVLPATSRKVSPTPEGFVGAWKVPANGDRLCPLLAKFAAEKFPHSWHSGKCHLSANSIDCTFGLGLSKVWNVDGLQVNLDVA